MRVATVHAPASVRHGLVASVHAVAPDGRALACRVHALARLGHGHVASVHVLVAVVHVLACLVHALVAREATTLPK